MVPGSEWLLASLIMLNLISHSKQLINPYLVLASLIVLEIQILLIMAQPPITMVQLFDLSADQRQRTTVGNSFTNKNPSGGILPFSNAVKYKQGRSERGGVGGCVTPPQ